MTAGEVCRRDVATTRPNTAFVDAVDRVEANHLPVLFVIAERVPIGILTQSEARRSVQRLEHIPDLTVADVMDAEIVIVSESENLEDTRRTMESFGVEWVPVVDAGGTFIGGLTVADVVSATRTDPIRDQIVRRGILPRL